jgi:hypothetical protein
MIRDLLNQGNGFRERMSATPLPEFEDPPVSEVSLSIIHRPLRSHGPPYTKAEEAEFYRRNANGPVTVARGADDRKGRKSQAPRGGRAIF